MSDDLYEILGVPRDANAARIKSAFRKLALKSHPDRNPGNADAESHFKQVNAAYQILSDSERRAAYDRYGHAAFQGGNSDFDFSSSMSDMFEDLFGDFVGGRGEQPGRSHGSDLRYDLQISLEDAFRGKSTEISIPSLSVCDTCKGTGARSGSRPVSCPTCGGQGRVRAASGFFSIERTCPTCVGAGQTVENPCGECGGSGRSRKKRLLNVNIPAGVEDGTRIRLTGEGDAGQRNGNAGDLYVFLSIAPHKVFHRDGRTLRCRVPIPMTTAALGGTIEVPTFDGKKEGVKIPSGTQGGAEFRLPGKGMPVLRRRIHGDMIVEVSIEIPQNLSDSQIESLREFESSIGEENSPETRGFFERVRDFWESI